MFNKLKRGMTLGELVVVFAIMGVVASMAFVTTKPYEKSLKYSYEKVYHTLGTAFYNAQMELDKKGWPACTDENRTTEFCLDGQFPGNSKTLCRMLIEYINTAQGTENANCDAMLVNLRYDSHAPTSEIDKRLKNSNATPHIIASNGVKYWIATILSSDDNSEVTNIMTPIDGRFNKYTIDNSNNTYTLKQNDIRQKYYVILADLNGNSKPNTVVWSKKKPADIVAFAIPESGEIIPLGYPTIDTRYMTAQVIKPDGSILEKPAPLSFYQAKRYAWAFKNYDSRDNIFITADNPLSLDYNYVTPLFYGVSSEISSADKHIKADKVCLQNPEDPSSLLDPTACYLKIKEYY